MPQAGRLIFFHNINDDSMLDATSFHDGEELFNILTDHQPGSSIGRTKNILVFFKTIRIWIALDCAAKARRWTRQTYYQ